MKKFFTPFTGYIQTDIFLTAAKIKGWHVEVFLKDEYAFAEITKGNLQYRICRDSISINSNVATKISKDKYLSNLILRRHIPEYVTQAQIYEISQLSDEIYQGLLNKYKKLVVKPLDQNNGVGVTTSLTDISAVKAAVKKIKKLGATKVLIENHVETKKEYRVMLWKGKLIDVLHRVPACVIGDGTSTIQELIEQKNKYRFENFENMFEPIIIDKDLSILLDAKNYTLTSVLSKDEYLPVKLTCNLSTGGEVKRIDLETIHPDFHVMFSKVYKSTWMHYCGLDLITPDITSAPQKGETVINELNGAPGLTLALYADIATNRPFYGMFQTLERMEYDPAHLLLPKTQKFEYFEKAFA